MGHDCLCRRYRRRAPGGVEVGAGARMPRRSRSSIELKGLMYIYPTCSFKNFKPQQLISYIATSIPFSFLLLQL